MNILEVLITCVILSVGILGNLKLQTQSVINNHDSLIYTQATQVLYNVATLLTVQDQHKKLYTNEDFDYLIEGNIKSITITNHDTVTVQYQTRLGGIKELTEQVAI